MVLILSALVIQSEQIMTLFEQVERVLIDFFIFVRTISSICSNRTIRKLQIRMVLEKRSDLFFLCRALSQSIK